MEIIDAGIEELKNEKMWQLYLSIYPKMTEETFMSFRDFLEYQNKPPQPVHTKEQILERWANYETEAQRLELPSAPKPFLQYFEDPSRPQTRLDRDFQNGFGVSIGRLREDKIFDWRFVCLSHNTIRGAAGGGILTAELLCRKGYITAK